MALPIIPKTTFNIKNKFLPKKGIDLKPFDVGQESLLLALIGDQGVTKESMFTGVRQLLEECIHTPNVEVGSLPSFIIEELFIRLRQHSISEVIEFVHTCSCENHVDVTLRLEDLKIVEEEGFKNTSQITDTIGLTLRYPNLDDIQEHSDGTEREIIIACIDKVFDGDEVHDASESTFEEKEAFFNSVNLKCKQEIIAHFFNKLPHVYHKIETKCSKCEAPKVFEFKDLDSVFI